MTAGARGACAVGCPSSDRRLRAKLSRTLANRWVEILHHLLASGRRYDEAVHQRNLRYCAKPVRTQPAAA